MAKRNSFAKHHLQLYAFWTGLTSTLVSVVNVLVNAEHATAEQDGPRRIAVSVGRSAEGMVRVAIRDNGPGIAAEVLPRIFDPFFTTKDVGRGTGLGLTITYGIIQEHHGTISAANAPGGGAQFTIDLPAAE